MEKEILEQICELFGLGTLKDGPRAIKGGLIHRIWFIQTYKGEFAVKELNADIMTKPNIVENFNLSERVANEFVKRGVPAIAALEINQSMVQKVSGKYVMVFPWIDGVTLTTDASTEDEAFLIGSR